MRESTRPVLAPEVMIISASSETLANLTSYLRAAGVAARGTSNMEELPHIAKTTNVEVCVLFPDDFRWETVLAALAGVGLRQPGQHEPNNHGARRQRAVRNAAVPCILVTAHPKRFEELTDANHLIIVPRPAWSWTILDMIRARTREVVGGSAAQEEDNDDLRRGTGSPHRGGRAVPSKRSPTRTATTTKTTTMSAKKKSKNGLRMKKEEASS